MSRRRKPVFKDPEWQGGRRGRRASERVELTDELVASTTATATERAMHDDRTRGLFVRIRTSGSKTYYYRQPGIQNKQAINLGSSAKLSVAEARAAAAKIQNDRAEGRMSRFSRGGPSRWTVGQAFDAYIATKAPSEWKNRTERTFRRMILPVIGQIKIAELDGDAALRPFTDLEGYYRAGTPIHMLSAFLTWARHEGHVRFNVLRGWISLPARPRPRRSVISPEDIGR